MEVVRFWEEEGTTVPAPYPRHIKVLLAPDRRGVQEMTFSNVLIHPHGKTDYHTHDRPELIVVISGRGISICEGKEERLEPDMALWMLAGEKHQVINSGDETLKLVTFFIPAYTQEQLVGGIMDAAARDRAQQT